MTAIVTVNGTDWDYRDLVGTYPRGVGYGYVFADAFPDPSLRPLRSKHVLGQLHPYLGPGLAPPDTPADVTVGTISVPERFAYLAIGRNRGAWEGLQDRLAKKINATSEQCRIAVERDRWAQKLEVMERRDALCVTHNKKGTTL